MLLHAGKLLACGPHETKVDCYAQHALGETDRIGLLPRFSLACSARSSSLAWRCMPYQDGTQTQSELGHVPPGHAVSVEWLHAAGSSRRCGVTSVISACFRRGPRAGLRVERVQGHDLGCSPATRTRNPPEVCRTSPGLRKSSLFPTAGVSPSSLTVRGFVRDAQAPMQPAGERWEALKARPPEGALRGTK